MAAGRKSSGAVRRNGREGAGPGRSIRRASTSDAIERHLDTHGIPDPDLVIRTSGEQRVSNFLTWQTAYSEFVFMPDFWPDFDDATFKAAIDEYCRRDRRFGGLSARAG